MQVKSAQAVYIFGDPNTLGDNVSKTIVKLEFEKETKNSVRYKETPEEGQAPIVGTLYVQKWFAGNTKNIEITIEKKE
jgi:hypothetical protein